MVFLIDNCQPYQRLSHRFQSQDRYSSQVVHKWDYSLDQLNIFLIDFLACPCFLKPTTRNKAQRFFNVALIAFLSNFLFN
jgi:hypothetical protein